MLPGRTNGVHTDVLLYAVSSNPDEQDKAEAARRVLDARELALSVRVLGEFSVQRSSW